MVTGVFPFPGIADAYTLHAQIRLIVTQEKEEDWFAFLPSPKPPEGYTEAAAQRQRKPLGTDKLPRRDEI